MTVYVEGTPSVHRGYGDLEILGGRILREMPPGGGGEVAVETDRHGRPRGMIGVPQANIHGFG